MDKPSWLRWPPNCCETCIHWTKKDTYTGTCTNPASTNLDDTTDSRFRCQDFYRKEDDALPSQPPV